MLKRIALRLIDWYQRRGGGDRIFGIDCNFEPSCSEYTKRAIEDYGFAAGVRIGLARIRRCNQPDLPHKIDDPLPPCDCHGRPDPGDKAHV